MRGSAPTWRAPGGHPVGGGRARVRRRRCGVRQRARHQRRRGRAGAGGGLRRRRTTSRSATCTGGSGSPTRCATPARRWPTPSPRPGTPRACWLVELGPRGLASVEPVDAPVPRPLARLRGRLEDLLTEPGHERAEHAWCQVTLTDPERPAEAMRAGAGRGSRTPWSCGSHPRAAVLRRSRPTPRGWPGATTCRCAAASSSTSGGGAATAEEVGLLRAGLERGRLAEPLRVPDPATEPGGTPWLEAAG